MATSPQPAPAAPAPAMPSNMGGFSSVAALYDQQRQQMQAAQSQLDAQTAPILDEINARSKRDAEEQDMMLKRYDAQMQQVNMLTQRQRLITINRAQVLRKVMPVVGLFALIGGALDGVSGATAALAGGLSGLSQGLNKNYQDAWKQYDDQVKTMLSSAKDTQAILKSIMDDNSKSLDEKLALLKVESAHVPAYNQINTAEANAYARFVTEHDIMNQRIAATEARHREAQGANKAATAAQVNDAMMMAFPFKGPDTSKLPITADVTGILSAAKGNWKQQYHMSAVQIATIASDYMHKTQSDWPTALSHTVNWLKTHRLLEAGRAPELDDADVESQMGAGEAPASNVRIEMAPGTPASVVRATRAAAGANAKVDAAQGGKTTYVDRSGRQYSAASVAQAAAQHGVSVAEFVKRAGLSYLTAQ